MRYFHFEEEHPFSLIVPLIEEGKLDPWEVDIVELANLYLEELRRRETLDLRVPARAIVAAAFLLKKKVEVLFPKPPRKPRERKYTLQEIVDMFEEEYQEVEQELLQNVEKIKKAVKRKKTSHKKSKRRKRSEREIPLHISRFEEVLEELWKFFKNLDVGTRIKFFTFLDKRNFVPQVMALLYLDYDNKIRLYQDKPFGDLEIEVLEA
ncbi:segregation/condensation protein A [Aquifex sp.]